MRNASKIATVIVIAIIILGGGYLILHKSSNSPAPAAESSSTPAASHQTASDTQAATPPATTAAATITYTSKGFEPASTTVKSGDTVKIANTSDEAMSFNSDPHPTHTDNPQLNVGEVDAGQSKTVTLTTKGNWGFHNHFDPSERGRIVVQ